MSYGKTLSTIELAEYVGQVLHKAGAAAVELGNFPLGRVDVQCAFEAWQADCVNFGKQTGRPVPEAMMEAMSAEVRAALAQLGWEF